MRESFILPRVTLAVTKRHFWVCHTRQMCSWYLCRDKNLRQFARTIYQFNIPVTDDMFNVVDISESEFSLLGSLCSLLLQFCQETSFTWSSVRNLLKATTTWYSEIFLLSFVTRFACDIGLTAKILDLSFILGHHHLHLVEDRSANRVLHFLLHCADETQQGRNSCPVWTLSCRCPVKLFTEYQPCIIVCYSFYFWLIRSFTDPT